MQLYFIISRIHQFIFLLCHIYLASSFNLENRLPIVKFNANPTSYFGYSVATHTVGEYNWPNNTKW